MLYCYYDSPVGKITITGGDEKITGLWLPGQQHISPILFPDSKCCESSPISAAKLWLDAYFAGAAPSITELPLCPEGTPFQQLVWDLLKQIPYGHTVTYGELARKVAAIMGKNKMSAQAIGGAVGRNPISIIIPCHRVIGADRSLTGYAGGIQYKQWLLFHEGHTIDKTSLRII